MTAKGRASPKAGAGASGGAGTHRRSHQSVCHQSAPKGLAADTRVHSRGRIRNIQREGGRSFGFIRPDGSTSDVYFRLDKASGFGGGDGRVSLAVDARVTFWLGSDPKKPDRQMAHDVCSCESAASGCAVASRSTSATVGGTSSLAGEEGVRDTWADLCGTTLKAQQQMIDLIRFQFKL